MHDTFFCVKSLQLCPPLCDSISTRLLSPWDSPGKNTGVGCHAFLQGIFPTQKLNPHLLGLLQILYPLSYLGSLREVYVSFKV